MTVVDPRPSDLAYERVADVIPPVEWAGFAEGGGPPPFGIQPLGTVAGAVPIGVATWSSQQNRADASDVIRRVAPISAAFRARPEAIFSHGFE